MGKKLSFEEWSMERNRKKETPVVSAAPTTGNTVSKMSFEEWSAQRNKQPTNTMAAKKSKGSLNSWLKGVDTLTKKAREYYSGWNGMTPDTDRDIRKVAQNYLSLANDWKAEYAGDEKSLKAISTYEKGLNDLLKYAEPKHKDAVGISSAYSISDADLEKKLADKDNPIAFTTSEGEEISWRGIKEQKDLSRLYGLSSEDLEKEQAKSGSAVAYTTMDGQNITWNALMRSKKKQEQYADLSSRDDWDELSQYKSTLPATDADYNDPALQGVDWAYELVNNPEYSSDRSDTFRAKYMTDEEREVFNYLYHTEGKDAALEWQYDLMHDLEELRSADIAKKANEYASQGFLQGAASWIGARTAAPLAAFEYIGDLVDSAFTGRSVRNDIATRNAAVDKAITDNVNWKVGNFDVFDFGYGTATSMVDSALASVFGGLGSVGLGLSAAASATNAALDRGMDQKDAVKTGVLAGIAEGVFEHVSIGNFKKLQAVDPKRAKDYVFNVIKSMGINASEEGLTEIANVASDILLNSDFSDYETSIRMNVQNGMTEEEARKEANKNLAVQIAESAASGAFMGVGFGTGGSAIGHARAARQAKQLYGSDAGALVQEALEIDPENAYAKQMQEKLKDSKSGKLSGSNLALLAKQNEAALVESDKVKIKEAAKARLTELGATEEVDAVADALMKQAVGEKLTRRERDLIELNRYAPTVAEELDPAFQNFDRAQYDAEWAESHDNRWVQQIGTERINTEFYNRLAEPAQIAPETQETENDTVLDPAENIAEISDVAAESAVSIEKSGDFLNEGTELTPEDVQKIEAEAQRAETSTILNLGDTAEAVDIEGIDSVKNGRMVLRLTDGRTVSSDSVTHASADANIVYNAARMLAPDAKTANVMVNGFKPGMNVDTYIKGIQLVHMYGRNNFDMGGLLKSGSAKQLPVDVRNAVYKAGQIAGGREVAAAQAKINAAGNTTKAAGKGGRVLFTDGGVVTGSVRDYIRDSGRKLKPVQEAGLLAMEKLAAALKTDLYVFESYINKDNRRVYIDESGKEKPAPNGKYYDGTGRIFIDLNAGNMGEGTMLYTVAHELTHFIKAWSPAKFKTLANIVVKQYDGESLEKRIAQQIEKAKRSGRKIDYDTALEEVVADSMESILADGNVLQMVEDIKKQDRTLGEKIAEWFKNLAEELKSIVAAYSGYKPDSIEGQFVAKLETGLLKQIEQLYTEGLVDAADARNAAISAVESETLAEAGIGFDEETRSTEESGRTQYSFRNSKSGMANDLLLPYDSDMRALIEKRGDIVIDSFEKLQDIVNLAFEDKSVKKTAYFGIIDAETMKQIEKDVPNIPRDLEGQIFKPSKQYSIAVTLDTVRHLVDEKRSLTRVDILDFLDRMPDVVREYDSVAFDYYTESRNKRQSGLLFKREFEDGVLVSFNVVSNKRKTLNLQTLYMERDGYKKKKLAKTPPVQNASAHTPEARVGQTSSEYSIRSPNEKINSKLSDRDGESVSNRSLLANAFEDVAQNDIEKGKITEYREKMSLMEAEEQKLHRLNAEIKELSFAKGPRDTVRIEKLRTEATKTANRIYVYDGQLLRLEASKPLQNVLEREKAKAYARADRKGKAALKEQREAFDEKTKQMQRELSEKYREQRKEAVEKARQTTKDRLKQKYREQRDNARENERERRRKTDVKEKIRKTIRELDNLLNHGNKKKNVKADMQGFVASTIASAEVLFKEEHSNMDIFHNGFKGALNESEQRHYEKAKEILAQIDALPEGGYDIYLERSELEKKLSSQIASLRDTLKRERILLNEAEVSVVLDTLANEYFKLKDSDHDYVKAAYQETVYNYIKFLQSDIGGAKVRDMTLDQLQDLYKAYTMAMTTIRDANKAFVASRSVDEIVDSLVSELETRKMPKSKAAAVARNLSNKIGWDYEKLYYALQRIGSDTLTKLFTNLADAEDIIMADVKEADAKKMEIINKYGYNTWNVDKKISKTFTDTTGKTFQITLGELMSLYAYSRREGAWNHIEYGGFVFNKKALTDTDPVTTYKLTKEQCEAITNTLTAEQKHFVEEMQTFLSETMGAKGNEVSMQLYGIEMFGEKNYFPVHVAGQFMARAQESQAKAAAGFSSMANAGFTQAQNKKAKAPFVMESFMDVWADHVNEMSRYHGTVPALEDIRKVMNYSSYSDAYADSVSVQAILENKYGKEAVQYFNNLYQEANSGAITDKLQKPAQKWLSKFRKNSVAYSASVLIQQPASIVRAYAMLPMKYFRGKGVLTLPAGVGQAVFNNNAYKAAYAEMLKFAPGVTLSKEIGGFDTASGESIRSYLLDTGKNIKQKWKTETDLKSRAETVMGVIDDNPIANLPNVADKIAWIEIWYACKRETASKNSGVATSSDEFMQLVGKRFTEVIRATQVYDSMFSKSPMLKDKNIFVQSLVSFMNESNTTANMVENAIRIAARGDGKTAAKTISAAACSTVLTCVLKSIVYAMRDDDEDKNFIEKYIAQLTDNLISDFTVFNYIPYARDIWSLAQGYDIERSDMAIISDAVSSIGKLFELATKRNDEMTEEELIEFDKKVIQARMDLLDSVCAALGIPEKNIRREIKAILNTAKMLYEKSGGKASWASIEDSVLEGIKGASPSFMGPEIQSKGDKLYEAIISGDTAYADRLKGTYKDEDAVNSAVRKALGKNDPRVKESAQALGEEDFDGTLELVDEMIAEGNFTENDINAAVNAEYSKLFPAEEEESAEKAKTTMTAGRYVTAVINGKASEITAVKDEIVETAMKNGKTEKEAEESLISSARNELKERYHNRDITKAETLALMKTHFAGNLSQKEIAQKVDEWTSYIVTGIKYEEIEEKFLSGEIKESRAIEMRVKYGGQTQKEAAAVVSKWKCEKDIGIPYDSLREEFVDGNITEKEAVDAMVKYGGIKQREAEETVTGWKAEKETGIAYGSIRESYMEGELTGAKAADMYMSYGGKSESEAEDAVAELEFEKEYGFKYNDKKTMYIDGEITESTLREALTEYGEKSTEEADDIVRAYDWMKRNPKYDLTESQAVAYTKPIENYGISAKDAGIDPDMFLRYKEQASECTGQKDENGKTISGTTKAEILAVINSLPISSAQKDALYYSEGWTQSRIYEAPWH